MAFNSPHFSADWQMSSTLKFGSESKDVLYREPGLKIEGNSVRSGMKVIFNRQPSDSELCEDIV